MCVRASALGHVIRMNIKFYYAVDGLWVVKTHSTISLYLQWYKKQMFQPNASCNIVLSWFGKHKLVLYSNTTWHVFFFIRVQIRSYLNVISLSVSECIGFSESDINFVGYVWTTFLDKMVNTVRILLHYDVCLHSVFLLHKRLS